MKSWQEIRLTRAVKQHDPKLFVEKNYKGIMQVLRESYSHKAYYVDGYVLSALVPAPHFIMALTDNWTASGNPCEWGIEPIMRRLQSIDSWNDLSFVNKDMENHNQKIDESEKREINRKIEDSVRESHSTFKRVFADVNTANMAKIDNRKKKGA